MQSNQNLRELLISIFVNKIGSKLSPEAIASMNEEEEFIYDLRAANVKLDFQKELSAQGLNFDDLNEYNDCYDYSCFDKAKLNKIRNLKNLRKKTPSFGDFCWPLGENAAVGFSEICFVGNEDKTYIAFTLFIETDNKISSISLCPYSKKVNISSNTHDEKCVEKYAESFMKYGW